MNRKRIGMIITFVILIMTWMIMGTAVSNAASKKAYKLPVKIVTQDGIVMKISYKGKVINCITVGEGYNKFTYKGKNKYKYKSDKYDLVDNATIKAKSGRIKTVKGKNNDGQTYSTTYYYKKGKLYKSIKNTKYSAKIKQYKKSKTKTTFKPDKRGNVKKALYTTTYTKRNGKVTKETYRDTYKNKYKGKYLSKATVSYAMKHKKSWEVIYADSRKLTYKKKKLTKAQYKRYKPIIDYITRDASILS